MRRRCGDQYTTDMSFCTLMPYRINYCARSAIPSKPLFFVVKRLWSRTINHGSCFYQESCPLKCLRLFCILVLVTDFCLFYYSPDALLICFSLPCSLVLTLYGLIYGLIYVSRLYGRTLYGFTLYSLYFTVSSFLVLLSWPSLGVLHWVLVALSLTTKNL